ncbi:DsbE family thiol:disulfide interchange protein [Sphingomonas sp. SUN039]|uniref:DsbE family thiol:disulfide interchange protein n=1 Tax=Sphingomonas sp. SUN039 TaxID=2937787 RepID=UPI002164D647|nr:DsbE family thiol:disulfide interchange protein [Sphingomonas sp. SUN039]UVO53489.1 DsbE family thiol:disulfide interchange protein [Sphingomonas sp. SUN039]
MKRLLLWLPLGAFVVFFGILALGLYAPDDRTHPSKLIGKPMPTFNLPPAASGRPGLTSADLRGQPRLVNVFASWCVPCATEAPVLGMIAQQGVIVDGIAIRDRPQDLAGFLTRHGNPFRAIGDDPASQVQIALGSSGVPETFVVDGAGMIRYQHIGPIGPGDVDTILAKLGAAR